MVHLVLLFMFHFECEGLSIIPDVCIQLNGLLFFTGISSSGNFEKRTNFTISIVTSVKIPPEAAHYKTGCQ